ncbi:ATP-grasp fold amidoligase family protein [Nesterenkonia alkaliphila]|uniref:Teichuronopeptide biosynthesis TupA-like protein n=1 Tax=Nesterenkonia alkaliphila TaxID=1463631 RepID=A0A7K1UIN3_9MICC|nr:ATP-grasp fold amidoligase family protein [Nesterenkonia alkaliphila]MVT26232.1 hypothetical protein [Nesterenkonia alkaliphila]GFZ84616.1 hypothetical protein GCM10011359_12020 [Nesterenkonia alkaliphila]
MNDQQVPSAQEAIELMRRADQAVQRSLSRMLSPEALQNGGEEHLAQLRELLSVASPRHVRDVQLHRMRKHKLYVGRSLSFMGSIVAKTEVGRLSGSLPGWVLTKKHIGYEFMDILDVRRPETFGPAKPFKDVQLTAGTVIKPSAGSGSKGVYLVFSEDEIFHAKDGEQFADRASLEQHAQAILKDRSSATSAKRDLWKVEELILSDTEHRRPAVDLKFWCFYGKVGFVSEINRHPETRWDFWSPEGERIDAPGRWNAVRYEGAGFDPEHLKLVERISAEIPYPFMRVDMLRGDGELVFGEFTPRPGSSNVFTPEWDRKLGEMWGLAENRLQKDLIKGKEFSAYRVLRQRIQRREKSARASARSKKSSGGDAGKKA